MLFSLKKKKYYIGIDLGGTNIACAIVDGDGSIYGRSTRKTNPQRPYNEIFDDMIACAMDATKNSNLSLKDIECVGIGIPGAVNYEEGYAFDCNNLKSIDFVPMADYISKKIGKKVYLDNDANAAAWGEYLAGCGKGSKNFAMVTLGTGVGGGMVLNGKIYRGFTSDSAEFGHMVIVTDGNKCTCGRKGCLETYVSATALVNQTKEKMKKYPDSEMWKIAGGKLSNVNGETPFLAKDKSAKEVVQEYTNYLKEGVLSIIKVVDPEVVCIGGGVSNAGDRILKPIEKHLKNFYEKKDIKKYASVKIATLNNDAGIIGAALIWKNED